MKKILLLFVVTLISAMCYAEEPLQLVITTLQGDKQRFDANSLTITVDGGKLSVNNTTESADFEISQLSGMSFANITSGADFTILKFHEGVTEIYSIDGSFVGEYDSVEDAARRLSAGIYIVKQNSKSFKIHVR